MALIPLEGLGAPSQKTNLLGGVAILIFSRPSPRLADVGLFVRPKSQHFGTLQKNATASQYSFYIRKTGKCVVDQPGRLAGVNFSSFSSCASLFNNLINF